MQLIKHKYFTRALILCICICGCKKVIHVQLKNADIQTVITGEVNDQAGPYFVNITKTAHFNADNNFQTVSGAIVTITGNGVTDSLTETSPGVYATHTLKGKPGKSYSLYVSVEGKIYTATSTMPAPVSLDSIDFREGTRDQLYAVANFQDPKGVSNYYQFIEYANGKKFRNGRGNSVFDDRLSDGRYINRILYNDSSQITPGIRLTVQMNCIDKDVFTYLNELSQISGRSGFSSPAPDNPTSNISGGALGYFSACSIDSISMKIP